MTHPLSSEKRYYAPWGAEYFGPVNRTGDLCWFVHEGKRVPLRPDPVKLLPKEPIATPGPALRTEASAGNARSEASGGRELLTSNPNNVEPYIWRFICAVYPSAPNLALASFSEEKALTDAADEIERLKRERAEMVCGHQNAEHAMLDNLAEARASIERLQRERDEAKAALAAASSALTSVGGQADRLRGIIGEIELAIACGGAPELVVERINKAFAGPAVETAERPWPSETAWLVERGDSGLPRYRTMEQGNIVWTSDVNKALRFARRQDAEMFCAEDADAWRVAEHMWTGPAVETESGNG